MPVIRNSRSKGHQNGARPDRMAPALHLQTPSAPTTHDPACDQCRIKKIRCGREQPKCTNCSKANIQCDYTDKGKRTNQTTKLLNDFEDLGSRLETLEQNVARSTSLLEQLVQGLASSQSSSHPSSVAWVGTPSSSEMPAGPFAGANPDSAATSSGMTGMNGTGTNIIDTLRGSANGLGRDHVSSSLLSLFTDAKENLIRRLYNVKRKLAVEQVPGLSDEYFDTLITETTILLDEIASSIVSNGTIDLSHDGQPLSLPPRGFLEGLVETFFLHINPISPIHTRDSAIAAIEYQYSLPSGKGDPAWMISFNNMILKILCGNFDLFEQGETKKTDHMHVKQLQDPFLTNARRAFTRLDSLMQPNLANVQALLSLCTIAQKYFSPPTTAFLLQAAVHTAKSMNLHRQSEHSHLESDWEERLDTYWALFVLDKHMALLFGTAPLLPAYDTSVPFPDPAYGTRAMSDIIPRITLAHIQEHIYYGLYSASAATSATSKIEKTVIQLDNELREWYDDNADLFRIEEARDAPYVWLGKPFVRAELWSSFYNSRIMVGRRSERDSFKKQALDDARLCIRYMGLLRVAKGTLGGYMVLRRPFQNLPFAAFFTLFSNLITCPLGASRNEDYHLLVNAGDMLREVAESDEQESYCFQLLRTVKACLDIAERLIKATEEIDALRSGVAEARDTQPPGVSVETIVASEGHEARQGVQDDLQPPSAVCALAPTAQSRWGETCGLTAVLNRDWNEDSLDLGNFDMELDDAMFWGGEDILLEMERGLGR